VKKFLEDRNRQQQESESLPFYFYQFIAISDDFLEWK
jgi:hypothetical protein